MASCLCSLKNKKDILKVRTWNRKKSQHSAVRTNFWKSKWSSENRHEERTWGQILLLNLTGNESAMCRVMLTIFSEQSHWLPSFLEEILRKGFTLQISLSPSVSVGLPAFLPSLFFPSFFPSFLICILIEVRLTDCPLNHISFLLYF